jgi:glycosyltransferase involved in cell wall biosynthesis/SAM-dependent methyltransferase
VVHYPVFGGPHNQALRLAGPLEARGYRTTVLLPDEPGNAVERLRAGGVDVVTMPLHRLRARPDPLLQARFALSFWREVGAIRRLIRERSIDLVEVSGLVNPHAAVAARLESVPVVWQIVDSRAPAPLRRLLMPLVLRLADSLMFDGEALVELHAPGGLGNVPTFVYYPPVDAEAFVVSPAKRLEARAALGIPPDADVVGMVANLNPQKGIEYFVRAAGLLHQRLPGCWFVVFGASYETHREYGRLIEQEVAACGVPSGRLIFAGTRPDLENWYPAMDVKLITSVPRSEGTTTTAMEAMACGVPVVATDVGAVREVVEDGCTGFVVPPLDPRALADATLRVLTDGPLRERMAAAAREQAEGRFAAGVCADMHVRAFEAAASHRRRAGHHVADGSGVPGHAPDLRSLLVCPACRGRLAWSAEASACAGCGRAYPVVGGIPVMLPDQHAAEHDELDHHHGHGHKEQQASFFDRELAAGFEVSRPHGTPRLYRALLLEKFRRSTAGLDDRLPGVLALSVCGGSGLDAELLARTGARVICSDISLGAVGRARERAERYGLSIVPLVADVEHLPFADRTIDLVYVHDGLHHLEDPLAGVREMARVASQAVSVTEPARAAATGVAIRLGLALEREEAGNRVARISPAEVAGALRETGWRVARAGRYAMYYPHAPGRIFAFLSKPGFYHLALAALAAFNAAGGSRLGNKATVVAVRSEAPGNPHALEAP